MADIAGLEARVTSLTNELKRATAELTEARIAESPIKIGDIFVRQKSWGYGRNAKTTEQRGRVFGFSNNGKHVMLQLLKKDGSDSLNTRPMYSWDDWKKVDVQVSE